MNSSHAGTYFSSSRDIRLLRVVTSTSAGCNRRKDCTSEDRFCLIAHRRNTADFALVLSNRFTLDTFYWGGWRCGIRVLIRQGFAAGLSSICKILLIRGLESIVGGIGLGTVSGILGFRRISCFRFEILSSPRTERAFGYLLLRSETEAIRTAFDSVTLIVTIYFDETWISGIHGYVLLLSLL